MFNHLIKKYCTGIIVIVHACCIKIYHDYTIALYDYVMKVYCYIIENCDQGNLKSVRENQGKIREFVF